jgi:hypothetical protein
VTDLNDQNSFEQWQEQEHSEAQTNAYRECALAMMRVLHAAIAASSESPVKSWGVMFAVSHPYCMGKSMSEIAAKLKVSRASISNAATEFCRANNLPPSFYMKSEDAQDSSRAARLGLIQRHNERKQLTNGK